MIASLQKHGGHYEHIPKIFACCIAVGWDYFLVRFRPEKRRPIADSATGNAEKH